MPLVSFPGEETGDRALAFNWRRAVVVVYGFKASASQTGPHSELSLGVERVLKATFISRGLLAPDCTYFVTSREVT